MYRESLLTSMFNSSFVRPAKFYLGGFYNIPHVKYYYVFLCFVYIMAVLGNGFLLSVIYMVKTLHSPKYIIVFNLAFTDLCGSTALIPKLLDSFLFNRRYIVYEACLAYMFFVLLFGGIQAWTLVTMAYDRVIAICFPLRYHSIVTTKSVAVILLCSWMFLVGFMATLAGFIDRLSFCSSTEIKSFFCDHGPIYQLACNDKSYSYILAAIALIVVMCIPLILIVGSYVCISITLSRTISREERLRALETCTSHLILVAIFFLPFLGTNVAVLTSYIHPNARIINSSLTLTVPPLLNPIIYSLKTEEVRNAIRKLCRRFKMNKTAIKL
ncbi:olfactory receptor 51A4-like [Poecilia latipinna]|uniref:olfactory receptor 51A4-like n=1 Tax=Poecilia latipinna TaxID=48699 RepID=UPI00072EEB84|nr:PREDICTED: olfactory receptor 51A4-like [Poecilia latipinna]